MSTVKVEMHAIKRAVERFGVENGQAAKWIREKFASAEFIGDTFDHRGNARRIFSTGDILFGVHAEELRILTVFKPENRHREIKRKVVELVAKEVRRIERKFEKIERESTIKIAELSVEIAQVNLRKVKSRSESVQLACDGRIAALNDEVAELRAEVEKAKRERHLALKTKAAYV